MITDCQVDAERLEALRECMETYGQEGDNRAEWPCANIAVEPLRQQGQWWADVASDSGDEDIEGTKET